LLTSMTAVIQIPTMTNPSSTQIIRSFNHCGICLSGRLQTRLNSMHGERTEPFGALGD